MPNQSKPATPAAPAAVTPPAPRVTPDRPRRLAACRDDNAAAVCWRAAMDATSTTQAVIAAVLGVDESLVSRAIREGTISSLPRLARLAADDATADLVEDFLARLHAKVDSRSVERKRYEQLLRDSFEHAMGNALRALKGA